MKPSLKQKTSYNRIYKIMLVFVRKNVYHTVKLLKMIYCWICWTGNAWSHYCMLRKLCTCNFLTCCCLSYMCRHLTKRKSNMEEQLHPLQTTTKTLSARSVYIYCIIMLFLSPQILRKNVNLVFLSVPMHERSFLCPLTSFSSLMMICKRDI
jgi:hypothetical protein